MTASPEVSALQRIADSLDGIEIDLDEIRKLLHWIIMAFPVAPVPPGTACCSHPVGTTCTKPMNR
jgi:hypothetical protein